LLFFIFTIPEVQTWAGGRVTNYLNDNYDTNLSIGRVNIKLNGQVNLEDVYVEDHKQDTLIYAKAIGAGILSYRNAFNGDISLGSLYLDTPEVFITTYKDEDKDSFTIFLNKFSTNKSPEREVKPTVIKTPTLEIVQGKLVITDYNNTSIDILRLDDLNATINYFEVDDLTVTANLEQVSTRINNSLTLEKVAGDLRYHPDEISLADFTIHTENSQFEGTLLLDTRNNALQNFNEEVGIEIAFAKAHVSSSDIAPYSTAIAPNQNLQLVGDFSGTLNDLRTNDVVISGMRQTRFRGDLRLQNITSDAYRIISNRAQAFTSLNDLKALLPSTFGSLGEEVKRLGRVRTVTTLDLSRTRVNAKGNLFSELGEVNFDILMTDVQLGDRSSYTLT